MTNPNLKSFLELHNCKLIRVWIQNRRTRFEYICKCGHQSETYWTNFRRYPNCKKCGNKKVSGDKCHMWNPDREAVAAMKKSRKRCDRMLRRCLIEAGTHKHERTHEMLGYTAAQLDAHLKSLNMQPGNVIDHIFPVKAFFDHGIHDPAIINHLSNLRPMDAFANKSKGDKYNEDEFKEWLNQQEYLLNIHNHVN